eukprot:CAMPEP_0185413228 /NCGR_PEP_ID=MMETSP1365-20130426/4847_1 /TAXON_ID=38817 /ORGANISM="Gephyrocapsa oceanica, Strain RCC1303" /LENGTH=109 /DNA_ID=CAMNT_0028016053 /DNA_START=214 /DNA_END=543 /DNA_ORIENTATION=+
MSRSSTALTLAEYLIATARFDVVLIGASSVPPCSMNAAGAVTSFIPRYKSIRCIAVLGDADCRSASTARSLPSASRSSATVTGSGYESPRSKRSLSRSGVLIEWKACVV